MENINNKIPTFDSLPSYIYGLSKKLDELDRKIDRLLELPAERKNDRQELMNIHQASELIGKTVGTIYTLTSDNKIPHSKRGNKLYFFKEELLDWIRNGEIYEPDNKSESDSNKFDEHLMSIRKGMRRKPASLQ